MKSPCGFLDGSRSPGKGPEPGRRRDPMRQGKAYEYKPKRLPGHPATSGGGEPRLDPLFPGDPRCFEAVILDDSGYEALPTSPVGRRGGDYTATDWLAGAFSAAEQAREHSPGPRGSVRERHR